MIPVLSLLFFQALNYINAQQDSCRIRNISSGPNETITYTVGYSLLFLWAEVGEVTFDIKETEYDDKPCYRITGTGKTYPTWDWFFKVRDTYQTWVDPETLQPFAFKRDVYEGGYEIDISYKFDWDNQVAYTTLEKTRKPLTFDTLALPECTYDVLSVVYFARNIDYSRYQPEDTIPVIILLDNEITPVYFRYKEKETIRIPGMGKFNCIKFSVFLVEGTLFKGGEDMNIWVTDDKNRIPLKITSPILVGSVKAKIIKYGGLRHKLTSKIR